MKKQILTTIAVLSYIYSFSQSTINYSQVEQTLNNLQLLILLDTSDNLKIQIKPSKDTYLKIDVVVESPVCKKGVIEFLRKSGRYTLKVYDSLDLNTSILKTKYNQNVIYINGAQHKEKITYTIHLPSHIDYKIKPSQQKENHLASR